MGIKNNFFNINIHVDKIQVGLENVKVDRKKIIIKKLVLPKEDKN